MSTFANILMQAGEAKNTRSLSYKHQPEATNDPGTLCVCAGEVLLEVAKSH